MVIPTTAFVVQSAEPVGAVARTPHWEGVTFCEGHIVRSQKGLIVVAYRATAKRERQSYEAPCTSTYRRLEHDEWRVVQHQQTPPHPPVAGN